MLKHVQGVYKLTRIKEVRKENDESAAQLARALGVEAQRFRRWDRGEVTIPTHFANKIAQRYGVGLAYILGESDDKGPTRQVGEMPVFGHTTENNEVSLTQGAISWISAPVDVPKIDNAYAVQVSNDSMEPRFWAGETVIAQPLRPARLNDYIVLQIKVDEETEARLVQLLHRTDEFLTVQNYKPGNSYDVNNDDVIAAHYIMQIIML